MDICIQTMLNAPTHDLSYDLDKQARREIQGDIGRVFDSLELGTFDGNDYIPNDVISSPRLCFIFVTGIPDGVTSIDKISEVITRPVTVFDISGGEGYNRVTSNHEWNLNIGAMPPPMRNALIADKYLTISFIQLKSWCASKSLLRNIDLTDFAA